MNKSLTIPIFCYFSVMSIYAIYGLVQYYPIYLILQEYRYPVYFLGTYLVALYLLKTGLKPRSFVNIMLISGAIATIAVILSVSIGIENAMTYSEIRPFQLPKNVIIDMVLILLCSNLIGSYITNKWISYILVPLGFFALIVSFTRKLWIVLVLVVLLFLLFFVYQTLKKRQISSKDSKMFFLLFFSSVLLVCLLIYSLPNLSDFIMRRFTETKGLNDPSIQNRWIFIIEPLRYARSIHFIGTGLGFDVLFFNPDRLQVLLSKGAEWGTYMENGYVYFILKTGILGLTIFLWMMIRALRTSLYLFQGSKDRFLKGISLWLFFYLIVITISSNFDQSFNNFMAAPPIAVHFSLIEYLRQRVKASVG